MSLEGLPVVDQAALPAEVRNGTAKQKQAYAAALGFERMLVEQLTKSLAQDATGAGSDDSEDGSTDSGMSGASMYSQLISSSLADSVQQQGGLGLANDLYRSLGK
jgi:Rod binding domain-containing protein